MPMQIPIIRKEGICRACGDKFERKARNQVLCPDCGYWTMYQGNIRQFITLAEPRLKKAADESGNPKIWTAEEFSQEELRRLIPSRS